MLKKFMNWWKAPKRAAINFKNIFSVIQSFIRRNDYDTPQHILEQIEYRKEVSNETCKSSNVCICGCAWDELIWADKQCEGKCYPLIMDKKNWENYKKTLHDKGKS